MSKSTGIVRKIDSVGRVTLPKETLRTFEIAEGDPLEFYAGEDGRIVLLKYIPGRACIFCGSEGITEYKGHQVCAACIKELQAQIKGANDDV